MKKQNDDPMDSKLRALIQDLIEVSQIDTVYRELFLKRARTLLKELLPYEAYSKLVEDSSLELYLNQKIRSAMNQSDWGGVKELSERMQLLQNKLKKNRALFEIGKEIYDNYDILVDSFSPGLQNLTRFSPKDFSGLRDKAVKRLEKLKESDKPWEKFYSKRINAFKAITLMTPTHDKLTVGSMTEDQLHDEAMRALNSGNLALLEEVADSFMEQISGAKGTPQSDESDMPTKSQSPDRLFEFSKETLSKAEKLGLVAVRAEAEREHAQLCHRYAWHPFVGETLETHSGAAQVSGIPFKEDILEPMKKRIELYVLHPFINSGGARHLPDLVAEDCLIEDFPEPENGVEAVATKLLLSLGLKKRRGLSRKQIEKALFENGPRIIEDELGLKLEDFRLVCIPSDIHLRIGKAYGWGNRELWTHFDGYRIMKDGKLRALAGGDVRFGGVYDLVTIGREYESNHLMARFAVVQRKRMVAW